MQIQIHFYSYFKDLTGCSQTVENVSPGETIEDLWNRISPRFPKLAPMRNSTLFAVGVQYQGRDYVLQTADEVSMFPPVQGG